MNFKKALSLAMATAMVAGVASVASFAAKVTVDSGDPFYYGDKLVQGDTFASNDALYVPVPANIANSDNFKFSAKKGDNAKIIKKISLVEKDLDKSAGAPGRENYVKIEIVEDMTDKEYKMNPTITFTAKKAALYTRTDGTPNVVGDKLSDEIIFWIKNGVVNTTDQEYQAGATGAVSKPVKNEDNEVIWSDVNRDLAKLTFVGDSDVSVYYPKLSTKWANDVYAANFADGEAYKFEFVGNGNISATARPTLSIYNPFIDDNDEYTVDVAELTVYQLIDDEFVDVTDKFTAETNDDGDQVLTTKTRTLGYYVVCDEAAAASGAITDEPVKDIPSTGR